MNSPRPLLHTWAIAAALLVPHDAPAADLPPSGSLDPVVVSGTRTEQGSFALPMSVDAVDGDRLRDGQIGVNLSESLQRIPGMVIQNRQNYAQDLQISIRGFGSRSTFGTRGIRLLVDDIPASSPDGQGQAANFDLDSAKRIEVLRGPFATIYGNASGGVIRAISRDGPAHPEVEVGFAAGSFGAEKKTFEAGGTIGNLNYLINSTDFSTHGYRDHSAARRDQTNIKLALPTDPQGTLTLVANFLAQPDAKDPTGLNAAQMANNPRQADATALRWNSRKTINTEQAGLAYARHLDGSDDLSASVYLGNRRVLQYLAGASLSATFSPGGVVELGRNFSGGDLHLTHRGQLLGGATEVTVGGGYELQAENRKAYTSVLLAGDTVKGSTSRFENDEVSAANLYLQGQWAPAESLLVVGGLRHSLVEFSTVAYSGSFPGTAQYSNSSPAIGLSWRALDAVSVYANYGRGFETPSFSELAYTPVVANGTITAGPALNYGLRPSTSDNYEAGVKALLGADTRLNVAAFHIATRDELAVFANVAGRSYYQNVPGTLRTGTELSVEHDLLAQLTAYAALTWLDATYSTAYTSLSIPAGSNAVVTRTAIAADNHLPGVGRRVAFAELAWHDPMLSAAAEIRYSDKVFANDTNSAAAGGYAVVNLRAGLHQQQAHWRFEEFVRVDNLFDRVYAGSVIVNDTNARYFEPAPTRAWLGGVRARYDFN
jgi:iron complex outermembrane receptor protein